MTTVLAQRLEIERLLADSPSLRREISRLITEETIRARRGVAHHFTLFDEHPVISLDQLSFTEDRVLGDWFPNTAIRQP